MTLIDCVESTGVLQIPIGLNVVVKGPAMTVATIEGCPVVADGTLAVVGCDVVDIVSEGVAASLCHVTGQSKRPESRKNVNRFVMGKI